MTGKIRFISLLAGCLLAFSLLSSAVAFASDDAAFEENSYDSLRVENEYKLNVPSEIVADVWSYLVDRYQGEESFLLKQNPNFQVSISEEDFTDRYFDTSDLKLLKSQSSVRHRARFNPKDPSNRKNGRNLIQMKLNLSGKSNQLNRGEVKFKIDEHLANPASVSLIHLIKNKQRSQFIERLSENGLKIESLQEKLVLKQHRRRVNIQLFGKAFSTITLDEAHFKKFWISGHFEEIEIELNEVNFTHSSAAEREAMGKISASFKEDLLAKFPAIKQDQNPKYNKAFENLSGQSIVSQFILEHF